MRKRLRVYGLSLLVVFVLFPSVDCANKVPPNLTPQATTAWYGTKAIRDLDIIRDLAQDGNAMPRPIFSTDTTRIITQFHMTAITVIHESPNGWKTAVGVALTDLENKLTEADKDLLASYIKLVWEDIKAVTQ